MTISRKDFLKAAGAAAVAAAAAGSAQAADQKTAGPTPRKVTAGKDALGRISPQFAHFNDDILFGEVWSRTDKLSAHDRSLITVAALMSSGILDSSLEYHIGHAKENGVSAEEMAEALTQLAFYAGWPKAWAAFRMAKKIYGIE